MNIKEAKEEIIHTVQAYMAKDEEGRYRIPPRRQRPLLLLGPPGIGKTAVWCWTGRLHDHPPHAAERRGSPSGGEKALWRTGVHRDGVYNE